jgi:hypothetical protein
MSGRTPAPCSAQGSAAAERLFAIATESSRRVTVVRIPVTAFGCKEKTPRAAGQPIFPSCQGGHWPFLGQKRCTSFNRNHHLNVWSYFCSPAEPYGVVLAVASFERTSTSGALCRVAGEWPRG